jgi:hypothetical protein
MHPTWWKHWNLEGILSTGKNSWGVGQEMAVEPSKLCAEWRFDPYKKPSKMMTPLGIWQVNILNCWDSIKAYRFCSVLMGNMMIQNMFLEVHNFKTNPCSTSCWRIIHLTDPSRQAAKRTNCLGCAQWLRWKLEGPQILELIPSQQLLARVINKYLDSPAATGMRIWQIKFAENADCWLVDPWCPGNVSLYNYWLTPQAVC